jgi:hypothetical protein
VDRCSILLPNDPDRLIDSAVIPHVAGIQAACRLEQDYMALFVGHWPVLDAAGHNHELTLVDFQAVFCPVDAPVIHAKRSGDDQKKFVLGLMVGQTNSPLSFTNLTC